jgi:hypothetical protein
MSQPTRFKKQFRQKLNSDSKIYQYGRLFYGKYTKLIGPFHVIPDFLIIGAARSGTTSLYQYLVQHPSIEPCVVKQLHFFDEYYYRGIDWYRVNFPTIIKKFEIEKIKKIKFLTGEATPYYLQYPHAPRRVYELNPNMKLILVLRNPVDRAFSHYKRKFRNGSEVLSFEEVTEQEQSRIKGEMKKMEQNDNYFSHIFHRLSYITAGLYAIHLKRWLQYFPMNQIIILENEEFLKETPKLYNQTLKFLDLSKSELLNYKKFQKSKPMEMDSKTRKKLIDYCKPFNEELYSLIGRRFDWDK